MKTTKKLLIDMLLLGSFLSIVYGFHSVSEPLAYIVGGSLVMIGITTMRGDDKK